MAYRADNNDTTRSEELEPRLSTWLRDIGLSVDAEMLDTYIFTVITVLTILVTVARSFLFFNLAMKASIRLHNSMFRGIT